MALLGPHWETVFSCAQLNEGSSLTLMAQDAGDLLTLGSGVAFTDDTIFGADRNRVFLLQEMELLFTMAPLIIRGPY